MAEAKRYYWLRLHDDFFCSKRIKKLRKMAGGDTYTIIYLKMQLLAMKSGGVLKWSGLEENIVEELALDLDELPENVNVTMAYLLRCGLAETDDNVSYFFPYAIANTGSETASTQRSRECRERKRALQCNQSATLLQRECNVEKEIEKEIEYTHTNACACAREENGFVPPSVGDVSEYAASIGKKIDACRFVDFYTAKGWRVGSVVMDDWQAAVRKWDEPEKPEAAPGTFETDEFFAAALNRTADMIGGSTSC